MGRIFFWCHGTLEQSGWWLSHLSDMLVNAYYPLGWMKKKTYFTPTRRLWVTNVSAHIYLHVHKIFLAIIPINLVCCDTLCSHCQQTSSEATIDASHFRCGHWRWRHFLARVHVMRAANHGHARAPKPRSAWRWRRRRVVGTVGGWTVGKPVTRAKEKPYGSFESWTIYNHIWLYSDLYSGYIVRTCFGKWCVPQKSTICYTVAEPGFSWEICCATCIFRSPTEAALAQILRLSSERLVFHQLSSS